MANMHHVDSPVNAITLQSRPISLQRFITTSTTESGVPFIREVIVIQTAASKREILSVFLTLLIYGIFIHVFVSLWEKFHPRSCSNVLGLFLFVFPFLVFAYIREYIFILIYIAYAAVIAKTYLQIRQKPMRHQTPRMVYRTFKVLTRVSYIGTVAAIALLAVGFIMALPFLIALALTVLFTSLYFGLLTRETSERLCSQMAVNIGYYAVDGVPKKKAADCTCAICDEKMGAMVFNLPCGHAFHEDCVKGWIFIGKKGFCPCCKENVDYGRIATDRWEKGENLYSGMVDGLRRILIFLSLLAIFGKLTGIF